MIGPLGVSNLAWPSEALDEALAFSVGRPDLPGGDTGTLHRSIRERLYTRNPGSVVVPGHGPSTMLAEELKGNPYVRP